MSKQFGQSEDQIKKLINFAEHLRAKIIIPSLELENFLNYQYSQISKKTLFNVCTVEKTSISKYFKRAFKTMSKVEQANYYSKCVKITLKQIYSTNQKSENFQNEDEESKPDNIKNTHKFENLSILLKKEGSFKKWALSKIQLASQISVLRVIHTGQELDLHHYILRESKSKEKPALVLQSTDQMTEPTTIRLTNYYESFGELKNKIEFYVDKALKEKIGIMLKRSRTSHTSFRSSIQGEIYLQNNQAKNSFKKKNKQDEQKPATLLLATGKNMKSMRKIILESSKMLFPQHENKRIYSKLVKRQKIFGLSSFKDFEQVFKDIFFNKKTNSTRKIFRFNEANISYEWLVTSINCYKIVKKWKPCLFSINLLAEFPEEKTKIYHQINLYKDYNEVDYVFLRHLFEIDGVNYYVDKSINTEEYGRVANGSRGWIQECIWRFRKIGSEIQLLVQVQFGQNVDKKNVFQMGIEYIGQVNLLANYFSENQTLKSSTLKTINNYNLFLFQDESQFNGKESSLSSSNLKKSTPEKCDSKMKTQITNQDKNRNEQKKQTKKKQKILFPQFLNEENLELEYSSNQYRQSEYAQTQYYSIQDEDSSQQKNIISDEEQNCQEQILWEKKHDNKGKDLLSYPSSCRYLIAPHMIRSLDKDPSSKTKETSEEYGHYIWRKQWKITDKGQLININEQQIKVQSSVLKLVVKKMGRNILSGKSVLNISLPIQIFGTDSNLQRLCKSMAYGPRFLEDAAKLFCPIERMKRVICFALGFSICYIQMQKPFNPILGQTYQGVIDGCPIYGEQISHHPPISTVLLKGRGYTVYANLQAKVDMGLNSASGINDGQIKVSFSEDRFDENVIKFTSPPGELSGLVMGERKLTLIKKSYYVDEKNMILGIIQWGSQKKKNQISFKNDYFDGQIVKLKPNTELTKLEKIKDSQFEKICCQMRGRWTDKVMFDNQVMFDVQKDGPYPVVQYPYPLQSNVHFREDIILRKRNDLVSAQQAKEKLEEIQRNDRKLRKKYQKDG